MFLEKLVKERLENIRVRGQILLEEMKRASAQTLNVMSEMAGERFLCEMTSVDQLLNYIRDCIEKTSALDAEMILDGDKFWALFDNERTQTGHLRKVPTVPSISSTETIPLQSDRQGDDVFQFSVSQLYTMFKQFSRFAPSGVMELRAFEELVRDIGSDLFAASNGSPLGGLSGSKKTQVTPTAVG